MSVIHGQNLAAYNTLRQFQPSIWGTFPRKKQVAYPWNYVWWHDDFQFTPSLTSATTAINRFPYMSYIDTSDTIVPLVTTKNIGTLRLLTAATDNNAPVITMAGVNVMLDDNTTADRMPLWFDCRWQKSSIADNEASVFIGFTEETRAINDGVLTDDSGVLITTIDGIGFRVLQDNGEELDFTYQKASAANQEMANIVTTANSAAAGLAASTYVRTGFRYSPTHETTKRTKVSVNNVEYSTYITSTQMAAATFPDGEELVFTAALKNGAGTATSLDLDYIWFAQQIPE